MNKLFCLSAILSFIFLMGCKKNKECHCFAKISAADKYDYPIKAGSPEWNAAGMAGIGKPDPLDSIYKLCQVPANRLQAMSTIGLIQSLEENPCLFNMLLRENLFQGRDEVLSRLNVSWVLNKRPNAGITIVNYYESKDPNCVACLTTDLEKGKFANNWQLFDRVCTQDSIINQLDLVTKKRFAKIIIAKLKLQDKYPEIFGTYRSPAMLMLSQLMINANFSPYMNALQTNQNLAIFANTGFALTEHYKILVDYAIQFSNI